MTPVVLINGASASGKSRLIAGLKTLATQTGVLEGLVVPRRITTRLPRDAETHPGENVHMAELEFDHAVATGEVDVHWRRPIRAWGQVERVNHYGFQLEPHLVPGNVIVLSGNNYLQWQGDPLLSAIRAESQLLVIRVWAREETRRQRLEARRPILTPGEMASRMSDVPPIELPPADCVIPNDPEFQRAAEWELLSQLASFSFSTSGTGPTVKSAQE